MFSKVKDNSGLVIVVSLVDSYFLYLLVLRAVRACLCVFVKYVNVKICCFFFIVLIYSVRKALHMLEDYSL